MRLGATREQIDGKLYDRLVRELSAKPAVTLLVVAAGAVQKTACATLAAGLEGARVAVRDDSECRAFIGSFYGDEPKLLEWRRGQMLAVVPRREKRLRRSPLASG
jgi:hypothetical protein